MKEFYHSDTDDGQLADILFIQLFIYWVNKYLLSFYYVTNSAKIWNYSSEEYSYDPCPHYR
jgi:hypothetical protein